MQMLEALKRKIQGAEDLQSVVGTMKTLAAVSIRQYETAVESLSDYYQTIAAGLRMVLWQSADVSRPFQRSAPDTSDHPAGGALRGTGSSIGAIVFGSDQGLCGQFNEQVVNFTLEHLSTAAKGAGGDRQFFLAVGARAYGALEDAGLRPDGVLAVPGSAVGIAPLVQELLLRIDAWRSKRKLGHVELFYNRRHSASSYRPHRLRLLPVDPRRFRHPAGLVGAGLSESGSMESGSKRTWPSRTLPLSTIPPDRLLSVLIRHYLFVSLFRASAESLAGENASRIASMQAAQRNIEERLGELRSTYNQLRQTSITEELLDVVTGFEALAGKNAGRT